MIDLKFDSVSKRYRVRQEVEGDARRHPLLRKLQSLRRRSKEFWAVRDVSFEVRRGEALGIIGHNGAGKSTILKLLSNITTPTSGEITINGRLSALIEVGSGFHPELTGRENVYLSGSILGMRRREITKKLDSIIDFAGVREFIDTPVKRFSSGMYVRLGFSIAAHLDPDILLLDEVLAVGDAGFQAKCIQRISELKQAGTTIVFISHDLRAVERLCDRVLLMQRGEVAGDGAPGNVIADYQRLATNIVASAPQAADLSREAEVTSLAFYDSGKCEATTFRTGDAMTVRVGYRAHEPVTDAVVEVFLFSANEDGKENYCHFTTGLSSERLSLERGTGAVEFSCAELGLVPSMYYVDAMISHRAQPSAGAIDWQHRCATLRVDPGKSVRGSFYMPHEWQIIQRSDTDDDSQVGASRGEVVTRL